MKKILTIVVLLVFFLGCIQGSQNQDIHADYHVHADFKVIIDGKILDFAKEEFMSTAFNELNPYVHLHDLDGDVIHFHDKTVSLKDFFESIGMNISNTCFFDGKKEFCAGIEKKMLVFVNGKQIENPEEFKPVDLDKILVFFGTETPPKEMLDSVTNKACIYSEKCPLPKGFVLPKESCSASKPCILPE